ncbi:ChbG/HpnK family deacetylase [Candidatus Poribacteria bacterium]|nr:ChbG/HpnK family deacetylase [Candidatus Poribacteria bacterium]
MLYAVVITLAMSSAISFEGNNLAEKLGYGVDDKLLIVHADDVGMSHSANIATAKALDTGIVTCGSIMVPCPWFPEVAAYCRENADVDLGIHLTLTSEWKYYRWRPVTSKDKVPGLIDEEGFLWHTTGDVGKHAKPEEVEMELRAQIERALEYGIKPTHLDTHMGTVFARPEFLEIYVRLAKEYGIPPMLPKPTPEIMHHVEHLGQEKLIAFYKTVQEQGYPLLDILVTGVGGKTYEEKKAAYHKKLRELKPGVNQIIVHLGMDDNEMKGITSSHEARYIDFLVFTDPETQTLIDEMDIKLIGWKDIKQAVDF